MNTLLVLLLTSFICVGATGTGVAQQLFNAPLPFSEVISAPSFGTTPLSLSPDGRWVAYELQDPTRNQLTVDERYQRFRHNAVGTALAHIGSDIWITNTAGETSNLTKGRGSNWAPAWSSDGKYLAFFSDRGGRAALWVWERNSKALRQLSDAIVLSYRGLAVPRWTPDSRGILFSALPKGMSIEEAATLASGFQKSDPIDKTDAAAKATVTVYRSSSVPKELATLERVNSSNPQLTYVNGYFADLVLVDVISGKSERIVRREKPSGYWISPDGLHVAFTNVKRAGNETGYDLVVVSLRSGTRRIVARDIMQGFVGFAVSWSPDGKLLAFTHYGSEVTSEGDPGFRDCFIVSLNGENPRKATTARHPSFTQPWRPPLWDATGQQLLLQTSNALWSISLADSSAREVAQFPGQIVAGIVGLNESGRFWSPDGGHSVVVHLTDSQFMRVGFSKVDLSTGKVTRISQEDKVYGGGNSQVWPAAEGRRGGPSFVYTAEDAAHRQDVWMTNTETFVSQQLTHLTPAFERYRMGSSRLVEWQGMDGQKLRGALLLPAEFDEHKRYPLIVWSYPDGDFALNVNKFGLVASQTSEENAQLLATRGYAVLFAESTARIGTHMQDVARTLLPAVDKVIDMGIADPERLGIIGHSHGGMNSLALIVQTTRFKAAVCYAGSGNLISMYGQMDRDGNSHWQGWAEDYSVKLGGSLWEQRDRYIANSPIFYLDRVETPLLIVQGTNDLGNLAIYADELFVDLKRLGKEVEYAKYDGEDHVLVGYANKVDFANRVIAWFDKHLTLTDKAVGPNLRD